MGIYTYHLAEVVTDAQGRKVGLLAFTGTAPYPFHSRDIMRNIARARRLSTATLRARTCNAPVALVAFLREYAHDPAQAPVYRWRYRRLSYTDGGASLRRA